MKVKEKRPAQSTADYLASPEFRVSLSTRLRMIKTLDSVTGDRISRTLRAVAYVLGILLTAYIVFLLIRIIGPGGADTTGGAETILSLLLNVLTVVFTAVTALQIYLMKDINHQEMSHQVFEDNQEYRKDAGNAKYQLEMLAKDQSLSKNFGDTYVKECYKNLRAFAFHYEYIGYLVFRNRLNFGIAFDTITFPDWMITSKYARRVITAGRAAIPDFWNGATHLYLTYEVKRKYNRLQLVRSRKVRDRAEIAACRADFRNACAQWMNHFSSLPQ